jgi:hypothetical protein
MPFFRRSAVGRLIKMDQSRGVAHVRTYVGGSGDPSVKIMHLPVEIAALLNSIVKLIGVQAGDMDSETVESIKSWEAKYDLNLVGRFVDSVYSAESHAISATGEQSGGAVIVTAYPVRSPTGQFTTVQATVGMLE